VQPGLVCQGDDHGVGLLRKLAGGREDQSPQLAPRAFDQAFQDRQDESGCLAGAGLGQAEKIAAFEDRRDAWLWIGVGME